jgi:hypothetical protein
MRNKSLLPLPIVAGLIFITGCNLPVVATTTPLPVTQPPALPPTATQSPIRGVFSVTVLVDLDSEPVTQTQAQTVVDEASAILFRLTGFTFEMVDFREVHNLAGMDGIVADYINGNPATIPNGLLLFSFGDGNAAKLYGGYSFSYTVPDSFQNAFQSPYAPVGSIYVGAMHFSHRFAKCGYGDSDTPVSDVSIGGECRNQPGTSCVQKYGYQICSTSVDDLYASTPTYFLSASFVHEMMHPFGPNGNLDHYWTNECTATMTTGASQLPYNSVTFDGHEANLYVNMCPYVFDNFVDSYQP